MRKEAKIKDSIKGFHWWLGALLLLLSACVTDYEPKGLEQVRDLLVVDGIITNGETTIKLRRSVGLTDDFTEDEFVNNAKVVVEREDGAVFDEGRKPVQIVPGGYPVPRVVGLRLRDL